MDGITYHSKKLDILLAKVRGCKVCASCLPFKPKPIIRANVNAKILIIGQAPGSKAHYSGIPWNDRSGDRLREWLHLTKEQFYNQSQIAIMPMGLCYPGTDKHGGDRPPCPSCAPLWHTPIRELLPDVQLTLLVGNYAQRYYLKKDRKNSLSETVQAWQGYMPHFIPLPHPSWRNSAWLKRNPWFEIILLPKLQTIVRQILLG